MKIKNTKPFDVPHISRNGSFFDGIFLNALKASKIGEHSEIEGVFLKLIEELQNLELDICVYGTIYPDNTVKIQGVRVWDFLDILESILDKNGIKYKKVNKPIDGYKYKQVDIELYETE